MGRSASRVLFASIGAALAGGCTLLVGTDGLSSGVRPPADGGGGGPNAPGLEGGATPDAVSPNTDAGGSAYARAVLADGPLAYWRLGEVASNQAADLATGANRGTYTDGVTLGLPGAIVGDPDTAAAFRDGYMNAGLKFDFAGSGAYSFEAWVNPDPVTDYFTVLSRDDRPNGAGSPKNGYTLTFNPGDPPQLYFARINGGDWNQVATTSVEARVWTHLVVTYDGASLRLYANGTITDTLATAEAIGNTKNPFTVGGDTGGTFSQFRGAIDEVAIYGAALTSNRVLAHYRIGTGNAQ